MCPTRTDGASRWHFNGRHDKSPRHAAHPARSTSETSNMLNDERLRLERKVVAEITAVMMTLRKRVMLWIFVRAAGSWLRVLPHVSGQVLSNQESFMFNGQLGGINSSLIWNLTRFLFFFLEALLNAKRGVRKRWIVNSFNRQRKFLRFIPWKHKVGVWSLSPWQQNIN